MMTSNFNLDKTKKRTIGCWYIGNTIICNKYCWIKQGIDIKCGKFVALKCINRYNETKYDACKKLQQEITVLKNLKRPKLVRLYSYNNNEKYPHKDGLSTSRIILLAFEYVDNGKFFDLLYCCAIIAGLSSIANLKQCRKY